MRRTTALIIGSMLMLAGCGGDGDGGDTAAADPATTTPATQAAEPPTTPAPATQPAVDLELTVRFDGETCSYRGPVVVPDGTRATFTFERSESGDEGALVVEPVTEEATWEGIVDWSDTNAGSVAPPWGMGGAEMLFAPGAVDMTLQQGRYVVVCVTSPWGTNKSYPAALIEVIEA